jgi:hypothetical protein
MVRDRSKLNGIFREVNWLNLAKTRTAQINLCAVLQKGLRSSRNVPSMVQPASKLYTKIVGCSSLEKPKARSAKCLYGEIEACLLLNLGEAASLLTQLRPGLAARKRDKR